MVDEEETVEDEEVTALEEEALELVVAATLDALAPAEVEDAAALVVPPFPVAPRPPPLDPTLAAPP